MNRRHIVILTAVIAVVLFAGAAVYQQYGSGGPAHTVSQRTTTSAGTNSAPQVKDTATPPAATASAQATAKPAADPKPAAKDAVKLGPPFIREHSPILGPEDAPVTITEFFDPACEACSKVYPTVKKIMAAFPGKVRVALRYTAFHKQSREAVAVLEAARRQNVFVPVLEALFEWQAVWAPHGREGSGFWSFVANAGLDVSRAQDDMKKPEIAKVIRIDEEDIKTLKVRQTPTFFVNGKPLSKLSAQQLYDLVKAEVEALR
jgi:protein-disulfide isomerase